MDTTFMLRGEELSFTSMRCKFHVANHCPPKSYYLTRHYHCLCRGDNAKKRHIPMFWENNRIYSGVGNKAMKRLNTIIGLKKAVDDDWPKQDMLKYGLGTVRKPEKFYKVFGIHVDENRIEHHLCKFVSL